VSEESGTTTLTIAPSSELPGDAMEFDHWSSKMASSPWDVWARLRSECPVAHSTSHGGFYVLSRYQDVFDAALDPQTFSSDGDGQGVAVPPQEIRPLYPIELDPPMHTAYRIILNPHLNPRKVASMEPWIRAIVRDAMDALPGSGLVDIAEHLTLKVPPRVAFRVLGFPEADHAILAELVDAVGSSIADRQGEAGPQLVGRLMGAIASRRSSERVDDILDAVVFGEVDGQPLTDQQIMATLILLLFGGLDTTSSVLACMVLWLADHPEDRVRLSAHPELLDTAVDEFTRWATPVGHLGRTAMTDTVVSGCPIPAGSRVLLAYGSANRDDTLFERPDEVLVDRRPNKHLAFGVGPHRCVGSHLARLQIRIVLEELLARMPRFRIPEHSGIEWKRGETRGITRLIIELDY
jgi:cytochrome P450